MKKITKRIQKKKFKTYWWKNATCSSREEDNEYLTTVIKSFDYVLTKVKKFVAEDPLIDIIISRNTKTNIEFFKFKVTGKMLITTPENSKLKFLVTYNHILEVKLKTKQEVVNEKKE